MDKLTAKLGKEGSNLLSNSGDESANVTIKTLAKMLEQKDIVKQLRELF